MSQGTDQKSYFRKVASIFFFPETVFDQCLAEFAIYITPLHNDT